VLSAATTIVEMFLHYVVRPCVGEAKLETNHYFAHLETKFFVDTTNPYNISKPWKKYLIYIIPIIGNIWAAWQDYNRSEQAKDHEKHFLSNPILDRDSTHYRNAAFLGSTEGAYRLGCLSLHDMGSDDTNEVPQEAMIYLRYAAAKGHVQANLKLREINKLFI
jgi:hypothetical protein